MANIGSLPQIVATSVLIFLVTIEKDVVLGCSGGPSKAGSIICTGKYGEFPCDDGKSCYTDKEKCDGTIHCADSSDEDNHHCGKFIVSINDLKKYRTKYSDVLHLYEDELY